MGRGGHSSFGGFSSGGRGGHSGFGGFNFGGSAPGGSHYRYRGPRRGRSNPIAGLFIGVIVFIIVAFALIGSGIDALAGGDVEYGEVTGTAVSNEYKYSSKDSEYFYFTTYTYVVDGKIYTQQSMIGYEKPETVGETAKLYYNISDPTEITEDKPSSGGGIPMLVVGVLMLAVPCILIGCIVSKKKKKKLESSAAPAVAPVVTPPPAPAASTVSGGVFTEFTKSQPTYVYCEYCGSRMERDALECPNCGANVNEKH